MTHWRKVSGRSTRPILAPITGAAAEAVKEQMKQLREGSGTSTPTEPNDE